MTLEEIKTLSIDKIEERMKEIRSLDLDKENVEELTKEVDALEERRKELKKIADSQKELREKILNGQLETQTVEKPNEKEKRNMELTKENFLSSKEYRSAFLKNLQGKELNAEERSAIALAGADPVVPEQLQSTILTKVKEYAPILSDITLLNVNGAVKFAVEGTTNEAQIHAENGTITADSDTLTEVTLSTYEITKLIQISASVKNMSINAFESWLVDMLVEAIAMKLEKLVFNGTGTSQAKGINAITWNAKNSVTVGANASLTAKNVYDLFGLMKEKGIKLYMNRKTLFGDFLPLMDSAKNNLVTYSNGKYYVLGVEAGLTDSIADHEALLGNYKKYVGNLAEAIQVKNSYDINTNSYKYLGVASFDGKPGVESAFVKLVKSSS